MKSRIVLLTSFDDFALYLVYPVLQLVGHHPYVVKVRTLSKMEVESW